MSGIVGAFHFHKNHRIDPLTFERQHQAILPWGDMGGGVLTVPGCGLGQVRRHADEAQGDGQPEWDGERRLAIVFDGVLGQPDELRRGLERAGHRLAEQTQAEMVLAAYRQWGLECVQHVSGTFAFAVFDRRAHSVFIARDRMGARPLYWHADHRRVLFSSSMQGILSDTTVPRVIDPEALDDFLSLGFVPPPRSFLRAVQVLPPGHAAYADGRGIRQWPYWTPTFRADRRLNLEQQAQALLATLEGTLTQGESTAVALSAGVGSALLAATAGRRWPAPVRAVTVRGDDDEPAIRTARHLGLSHTLGTPSSSVADRWQRLTTDGEEPFDAAALVWLGLGEVLASTARSAWSGVGTDVVFGSEDRYRQPLRAPQQRWRRWRHSGRAVEARYAEGLTRDRHRRWYSEDFRQGLRDYRGLDRWLPRADEEATVLDRLQAVDLALTVPHVLRIIERTERHIPVAWRHPFADGALVDFSSRLPDRYRVDVDHDRVVLRAAARRLLPPQVAQRRGRGLDVPTAAWLKGAVRSRVEPLLFGRRASGVFDPEQLRRAWYRLQLGGEREAASLWRVAAFEAWAQRLWPDASGR